MNFFQTGYKGKTDWWMYIVMFFIVFLTNVFAQIPITFAALIYVDGDAAKWLASAENGFTDLGINSNLYLFLMLLTFIVPLIFFIIALKGMHKKKFAWVVTSREKIDWKRVLFGVLIWGGILVGLITIDIILNPDDFVWNFKLIPFVTLCFVSILFIPLQTTLEEVLFRGYYMQAIGMWLKNKWAPLIIMSVVFGGLHALNPEIQKLGYIALVLYIGSGFLFGIVTLMDEGAELAIGMHAVNNVIAALFVTTDWAVFQTDAIYLDVSEPSVNIEILVSLFIIYPAAIFIFSKKYGWKNWKDKLFGKVEKPVAIEQ